MACPSGEVERGASAMVADIDTALCGFLPRTHEILQEDAQNAQPAEVRCKVQRGPLVTQRQFAR